MYAHSMDCIVTFPIFHGNYGKNALALKLITRKIHAIPQFKANDWWHAMVPNLTYLINVSWYARCLIRSKVKDLRRFFASLARIITVALLNIWISLPNLQDTWSIALNEYESLKESDQCDQWFWFYSKNRGFRFFGTGHFSQILDSTRICIFY